MVRGTCLVAVFVMAALGSGCKKSGGTADAGKGGSPSGGVALSSDDALAREWIQSLNDYAEVLEKNGTGEQRRAASAKWQEKVRAIQALPRERQIAMKEKFKNEIAAAEERYKKARASRERATPKPPDDFDK